MRVTFSDLPDFLPADEGNSPRRAPRIASSGGSSRRDFLRVAVAAGIGGSIAVLGWLPPARKAIAGHGSGDTGYRIKPLPCPDAGGAPPNGWDQGPTNCAGCCCSTVCGDCCQTDTSSIHYGWHRTTGVVYKLRPGDCTSTGNYDGWIWDYGSCCNCNSYTKWRCHDGKKCDSNGNNCQNTVCKWILERTTNIQFCCP